MLKEQIIFELQNEINHSKYNNQEKNNYINRTINEAEELLTKISNGNYDDIINSTKVRLDILSMYDSYRKAKKIKKPPSLKDYRIYTFIKCINEKINEKNLITRRIKLNSYKPFLKRINSGLYDDVLSEKDFYFWETLNFENFFAWDYDRQHNNATTKVNLCNYVVYSIYTKIMSDINFISNWKKIYGTNFKSPHSYIEQTPATSHELEQIKKILPKILNTNYDWKEAREVSRAYNKLNTLDNENFPHNIDEIAGCFVPVKHVVFDQYNNFNSNYDIKEIVIKAEEMFNSLTPKNFYEVLFTGNDKITQYLRKMIISQFDYDLLAQAINHKLSENQLRQFFEHSDNYQYHAIKKILSDNNLIQENLVNQLYDISCGTLFSIFGYCSCDIKILDVVKELQEKLNCNNGTVYYNDFNTVVLPNGKKIYSTNYENIKSQYSNFQKEFDYYINNSSSSLEYIEGCTEILGNVVLSQIFRIGNKRTAKCLFNAMLINKGILPPIIDFNKKHGKLWLDFAYNKENKYMNAKNDIIENYIKLIKYFESDSYDKSHFLDDQDCLKKFEK